MNNRHEIKRGLFWLGSAHAVMRALELGSLLLLFWLLSEKDMGLAALSWTVAVILEAYNGLGIGTALVQSREVSRRTLDSAFWFTLGLSLLLVLSCSLLSPWLAQFFGEPRLAPMIVVASSNVLWTGAAIVPLKVLTRELRFKEVAAAETISVGAAALVKIVLAASGLGAWALVIGHAAEGFALLVALNLIAPYRPALSFAWSDIKKELGFGIKVAMSGIVYHTYRNLDYVVVGKFFGAAALGVYRVAFEVAMSPSMAVLGVINGAAFPVYSRLAHDPPKLKESFLWTTRNLVVFTGPIAVFLAFSAPHLIPLIAQGKWIAGIPIVQVLCWAALLRSVAHLTPQLLHASGRADLAVYDSVLTLMLLALMFWACSHFGHSLGVMAIAWGWLLVYPAILWVLWVFARRVVDLGLLEYLRSFGAGLMTMAVVAFALGVLAHLPLPTLPPMVVLGMQLVTAAAATLAFTHYALGFRLRSPQPPA